MNKKLRYLLLALIFINGYISLSLELIALRQVSSFVGSTSITASIIIGVFLAFMSIGYYHGSAMSLLKARSRNIIYLSFIVIAIMIIISTSFTMVVNYFALMSSMGIKSNIAKTFIYSTIFLSVTPYLFGLNTALISRYLHKYSKDYTGRMLAIDTIGSVLGSLLTTLILMPLIGVNQTIVVSVIISFFGAYIVKPRKKDIIWFGIVTLMAFTINNDDLLYKEFKMVENNAVSTIIVHDTDKGQSKTMFMNGSGASKYSQNRELLVPLVKYIDDTLINTLPKDRKRDILILGAGAFTIGDIDEFHNYTFVDVDASLLEISEKYVLEKKLSPNKKFVVEDANQFLKDEKQTFDLIILDTYSSLEFIPQDLITKEYFERVKERLKPNGIVAMNIVSRPSFNNEFTRKIDNTIHYVFKHNIQRQIIGEFNAWDNDINYNALYIYYNITNNGDIYTHNKNSFIYDM